KGRRGSCLWKGPQRDRVVTPEQVGGDGRLLLSARSHDLCWKRTGSASTARALSKSARRAATVATARRSGRAAENIKPRTARGSISGRTRRSLALSRAARQSGGVRSSRRRTQQSVGRCKGSATEGGVAARVALAR